MTTVNSDKDTTVTDAIAALPITLADVSREIVSEHYFTAFDGVAATMDHYPLADELPDSMKQITICVLVLKSGKVVTGEFSCDDPNRYSEKQRRSFACDIAAEKVWELLGCKLRDDKGHLPEVVRVTSCAMGFIEGCAKAGKVAFIHTQHGKKQRWTVGLLDDPEKLHKELDLVCEHCRGALHDKGGQ